MRTAREANRFPARLALCSCLLMVACTGRANDGSKSFANVSPQHPMASAVVLKHLFNGGGNMCADPDLQAKARINEPDCLAYIEKTRPVCEQESLAKMPASISSKPDLRKFAIEFYFCLMPK